MNGAVGVILAGGASRRMGTDKALIDIDGRPLIARVADALRSAGISQLIVVGGDGRAAEASRARHVADAHPGQGPLGGLLTALEHGGGRDVQLCSCDLVALSADVIVALGTALATDANLDAAVANSGRLEPMCSRWRPRTIPTLRSMFDAGERALASVIGALRVVEVVVPAEALVNVNTPEDLGRWRTSPSGPAALA